MNDWPLRLYSKSVLKQAKYRELVATLGPTEGLSCLDVGADNGVISYLLRRRGGNWKSADLDEETVAAIAELVGSAAYQIDGGRLPFADDEFDRVVIVDALEHIADDGAFVAELRRILKPGGLLVVNVPHRKRSLLRLLRLAIGQTDEKHGHLRPGYTRESLLAVLGDRFVLESARTYSKFFSELVDTIITYGVSLFKRGRPGSTAKGQVVTGRDLKGNRSLFRAYALVYPFVWLLSRLDALLPFASGYMLITRARSTKAAPPLDNTTTRLREQHTLPVGGQEGSN
ncbi:MAG: class I SAM-dependent methyltransferase [Chloroflexota bacterium]